MIRVEIKLLIKKLNSYCTNALEGAIGLGIQSSHTEITVLHWLDKLLQESQADFSLLLDRSSIDKNQCRNLIRRELATLPQALTGKPIFATELLQWLQEAWLISSVTLGAASIRSSALLLGLLSRARLALPGTALGMFAKLSESELQKTFWQLSAQSIEAEPHASSHPNRPAGGLADLPTLNRFGEDLTEQVRTHKIDPVLGRENEIRQMIDILCRRRKNNVILVGEAGVGKTALVEGLAAKVVLGDVPAMLEKVRLFSLDLGLIEAGAGMKGEFEQRLKSMLEEIENSVVPVVLFIDEAHLLIGGGGHDGHDAANLLKPALARGKIRVIAATTWTEYKKYIEKDPALKRRFQLIKVNEPDVAQTLTILRGLRAIFEDNHKVIIRDDALQACASLSTKYLTDRQQPDKAIDLLDTASARVYVNLKSKPSALTAIEENIHVLQHEIEGLLKDQRQGIDIDSLRIVKLQQAEQEEADQLLRLQKHWQRELKLINALIAIRLQIDIDLSQGKKRGRLHIKREQLYQRLTKLRGHNPLVFYEVDPDVIAGVVADWTHIPLGKLLRDEAENLLILNEQLQKRIKAQKESIHLIAEQLKLAKAGLKDPCQPLGVFLLTGPSGVGKTETALTVADVLFGGEESLVTINMSEFQEKHALSRLIGSPPGYVGYGEGGLLTEAVRKRPYCVILLDEVEKAHPDILNLFYQVFDKGILTDGEGRAVLFNNSVIFLTSNLATEEIMDLGLNTLRPILSDVIQIVRPILSKWFKPALLARMNIVPYLPLNSADLLEIMAIKLEKIEQRMLREYRIQLCWHESLNGWLMQYCNEFEMGARNIDLIIAKHILPILSEYVLIHLAAGDFAKILTVKFDPESSTARLEEL